MTSVFQLIKRLLPQGRQQRTILTGAFRGVRLFLDLSRQSQTWFGLYERETYGWLRRLSRDIKSAIDVGTAEGEFCIYFLVKTSVKKVLAFDPNPENHALFQQNLRLNNFGSDERVRHKKQLVGEKADHDSCRLDEFLEILETPCFIKIDVDGGELEVLRGAGLSLNGKDIRFLVETHSTELERECQSYLLAKGFEVVIIKNAWWRCLIWEQRPIAHCRWLVAYRP